eukprot:m.79056 g.79056  ORF g.79056 m.79056 type:complete len:447 (-) comp12700_c0_seq3:604-1944(-)
MPKAKQPSRKAMMQAANNAKGSLVSFVSKQYKLGQPLASGAFGAVLSAKCTGKSDTRYVDAVVKLGLPSDLQRERKICQLLLLQEDNPNVTNWMERLKLRHLGLPRLCDGGPVEIKGFRFEAIVFQKLGPTLESELNKNNGEMELRQGLNMWTQIVDALRYMHSRGYAHCDIKPSNICMGLGSDHMYLVDFGTVSQFANPAQGNNLCPSDHFDFEDGAVNPSGPNGTLSYACLDAHSFATCTSRRGDLESLGYLMLDIFGSLPWRDVEDHIKVHKKKKEYFKIEKGSQIKGSDLRKGAESLVKVSKVCESLEGCFQEYMIHACGLGFKNEPDYDYVNSLIKKELSQAGAGTKRGGTRRATSNVKRKSDEAEQAPAPTRGSRRSKVQKPSNQQENKGIKVNPNSRSTRSKSSTKAAQDPVEELMSPRSLRLQARQRRALELMQKSND